MWHYFKFLAYNISIIVACISVLFADYFVLLGFITFILFYVLGDALLGNDLSNPNLANKKLLNILLYSAVPTTLFLFFAVLWISSPSEWLIMKQIGFVIGYDFILAKAQTDWWEYLAALLFCGLMLSGVATVVGHELIHRMHSKFALVTGRWLMAASLDANFSIEHVFGHHVKVATTDDPATAPRGRNVYLHVAIALYKTNQSAIQIENKRLAKTNTPIVSSQNRWLRGYLMSLIILGLSFLIGGLSSLLFMLSIGFISKCILEIVNYMEHYGLVRHERQRVEPKHSWNSNKKISCWAMFNLPRHSHHHAKGAVPFEKLESMPEAPQMISGYISTLGLTLIPPLWYYLMSPRLKYWDQHFANDKELSILESQQHISRAGQKQALI